MHYRTNIQSITAAALEISMAAAEDQAAERQKQQKYWLQRLERTHIDSERAVAYNAVEPENRLWQEHLSENGRSVGSRIATEDTIRAIFA